MPTPSQDWQSPDDRDADWPEIAERLAKQLGTRTIRRLNLTLPPICSGVQAMRKRSGKMPARKGARRCSSCLKCARRQHRSTKFRTQRIGGYRGGVCPRGPSSSQEMGRVQVTQSRSGFPTARPKLIPAANEPERRATQPIGDPLAARARPCRAVQRCPVAPQVSIIFTPPGFCRRSGRS
jgi:hypothetical protein